MKYTWFEQSYNHSFAFSWCYSLSPSLHVLIQPSLSLVRPGNCQLLIWQFGSACCSCSMILSRPDTQTVPCTFNLCNKLWATEGAQDGKSMFLAITPGLPPQPIMGTKLIPCTDCMLINSNAVHIKLASFPGPHAQLLSLAILQATKAGHGGLGTSYSTQVLLTWDNADSGDLLLRYHDSGLCQAQSESRGPHSHDS